MSATCGHPIKPQWTTSRKTIWYLKVFVLVLTVLLHSQEVKKKRLRRGEATSRPYHIVANLGLAVDDSLLSADQTVQASHGGACKKDKKQQSVTMAQRRQRNWSWWRRWTASCAAAAAAQQQSSFFPSAKCEGCQSRHDNDVTFFNKRPSLSLRCALHSAGISQWTSSHGP